MKSKLETTLLILLIIALLIVGLPRLTAWFDSQGEAREIIINVVNQSEQAQNVMVQPPPAIQPQPVQQAAPSFTPGQLADCAYAQAAGLPSAGCPENAGEVLGVGR
jgi:hypothetical protein